ncbi:MAG: hypothetical protein LBL21_04775 [Rickettsiales bacterium]|jgi:hypothetical protein|nr:hypothetical protein [Rickettsiales bacterium]
MKKLPLLFLIFVSGNAFASTCSAPFGAEDSYFEIAETCPVGYAEDASYRFIESGECSSLGSGWVEDTGATHAVPPAYNFSDGQGTYHYSNMTNACVYQ